MMHWLRKQPALTLALVVVQVITVLCGPAALVRCFEADGSSHIESLTQRDCAGTPGSSEITPREQPSLTLAGSSCAVSECIDSLIHESFVLRATTQNHRGGDLDAPAIDTPTLCTQRLADVDVISPQAFGALQTAQPVSIHRSLRATILIL